MRVMLNLLRLLVVIGGALSCANALATQGMKFTCNPKPQAATLTLEGVTIVDYTSGTEVPEGVDTSNPIRYRCQTPAGLVRIHVAMRPASERGECGLDPGGDLTLWIEGMQVLRRLPVNNDCFTSIKTAELTLISTQERRWSLRLCGPVRTTIGQPIRTKCIERDFVPSKDQPIFDLKSFETEMKRP